MQLEKEGGAIAEEVPVCTHEFAGDAENICITLTLSSEGAIAKITYIRLQWPRCNLFYRRKRKTMYLFEGSATALVTPMNEDYSVNYEAYEALVQKVVDGGVQAIIVNGTTAEASTLTVPEEHTLIKKALAIAKGKCKVIAGTGSNDTMYALEQCKQVEALGVDGLLVVTPYYNKTSQRGLLEHYKLLADNVNIPILLYNVPGRTGLNISEDVVVELSKHKNIAAIKDATGNMSYAMNILARTKDNPDFCVYSGNDDIILPMIAAGGKGVISVVSNVYPRETEMLCQAALKGDLDFAQKLAYDLADVNKQLFSDVNPICAKAALAKQGICGETLRLPLIPTTEDKKEALYNAMSEFEKKGY